MSRIFRKAAVLSVVGVLTALGGCASVEDVKRAQATADQALTTANSAQQTASTAQSTAQAAQSAAQSAQQSADRANAAVADLGNRVQALESRPRGQRD